MALTSISLFGDSIEQRIVILITEFKQSSILALRSPLVLLLDLFDVTSHKSEGTTIFITFSRKAILENS